MADIRGDICKIISKMLDNPDQHGIYPTTECYDAFETYIKQARLSALQECREIAVNAPIATEMRDADKDVLRSKRDKVHAYSAGLCNASNHMRDQIQSLIDKEGSKET